MPNTPPSSSVAAKLAPPVFLILLFLSGFLAGELLCQSAKHVLDFGKKAEYELNFFENPSGSWRHENGFYKNVKTPGVFDDTASIRVEELGGDNERNFRIEASFVVESYSGTLQTGFGILGEDAKFQGGDGAPFYIADIYAHDDGRGGQMRIFKHDGSRETQSVYFKGRNVSLEKNEEYTIAFTGRYAGGTLAMEFTVSDGAHSKTVSFVDESPISGSFFGLRNRSSSGDSHVVSYKYLTIEAEGAGSLSITGQDSSAGESVSYEDMFRVADEVKLAETIDLSGQEWLVRQGDDSSWKEPGLSSAGWSRVEVGKSLFAQGRGRDFYWYRTVFEIPERWREKDSFLLDLGRISFYDKVFLNGEEVGTFGAHPPERPVHGSSAVHRKYFVDGSIVRFGSPNTLAVRVYTGGQGGMYSGPYTFSSLEQSVLADFELKGAGRDSLITYISNADHLNSIYYGNPVKISPRLAGLTSEPASGILRFTVKDENGREVFSGSREIKLEGKLLWSGAGAIELDVKKSGRYECFLSYRDASSGRLLYENLIHFRLGEGFPEPVEAVFEPGLNDKNFKPSSERKIHLESAGSFGGRNAVDGVISSQITGSDDSRGALSFISLVRPDSPDILIHQNNVSPPPMNPFPVQHYREYAGGRRYDMYSDMLPFGYLSIGENLPEPDIKVVASDWVTRKYNFGYSGSSKRLEYTISKISPAFRLKTNSNELKIFDRLSLWGLGQPAHIAYLSSSGSETQSADSGIRGSDMAANWILAWFNGSRNWDAFDVPWLFVLENRPDFIRTSDDSLRFEFRDEAGVVFGMPLFGVRLASLYETDEWSRGLPEEIIELCGFWSKALLEYPVAVEREFNTDFKRNVLTIKDKFLYEKISDRWGTVPLRIAPVPPTLMLSAISGNIDIRFGRRITDCRLTTLHGPYTAVKGADSYIFSITGLLHYIGETREVKNIPESSAIYSSVSEKLSRAMEDVFRTEKLDSHPWGWALAGGVLTPGRNQQQLTDLILSLPYVRSPVRLEFINAIKNELKSSFLLWGHPDANLREKLRDDQRHKPQLQMLKDSANGLMFATGQPRSEYGGDAHCWEALRLYSFWQIAHHLDMWDDVLEHWEVLKIIFNKFPHSHDWAICQNWDYHSGFRIGNGLQESSIVYAGLTAFARIADKAGDEELVNYASYLALMQVVGLNAATTGIQYFRVHRPWAASHSGAADIEESEKNLKHRYVEFNEFAGCHQSVIRGLSNLLGSSSYNMEQLPENMRLYNEVWERENSYFFERALAPVDMLLHMRGGDKDEIRRECLARMEMPGAMGRVKAGLVFIESLGDIEWVDVMEGGLRQ